VTVHSSTAVAKAIERSVRKRGSKMAVCGRRGRHFDVACGAAVSAILTARAMLRLERWRAKLN
jgi:hypothetical protein